MPEMAKLQINARDGQKKPECQKWPEIQINARDGQKMPKMAKNTN